jgi:uncharacterized membrane protein YozB (DUF420 family)
MTTLAATPTPASSEHRFFTGIACVLLAAVLLGFARSFFLRPLFPGWPSAAEPIFYLHGVLFTAWIVLFVVQASLVAQGRTDLHRRVGPWGAALALAMVVLGTLGALVAARRATGFTGVAVPPLQFLAVPLFDMLMFALFVALAVAWRRRAQHHKRLMLLATISITTAAIARWPGVLPLGPLAFFGITDLFIVALALWDRRSLGRVHAATLWGGLALVLSQALRLAVSGSEPWLGFARWATGLLG